MKVVHYLLFTSIFMISQPLMAGKSKILPFPDWNSLSGCTEEYESKGICKILPNPDYLKCVVWDNDTSWIKDCTFSSSALFVQRHTGRQMEFLSYQRQRIYPWEDQAICFDYQKNHENNSSFDLPQLNALAVSCNDICDLNETDIGAPTYCTDPLQANDFPAKPVINIP